MPNILSTYGIMTHHSVMSLTSVPCVLSQFFFFLIEKNLGLKVKKSLSWLLGSAKVPNRTRRNRDSESARRRSSPAARRAREDGVLHVGPQRPPRRGEGRRRCLDQRAPLPRPASDRRGRLRLRLHCQGAESPVRRCAWQEYIPRVRSTK
jgi:hypothetical protein